MGEHPVYAALTTDCVRQLIHFKARQLIRHSSFAPSEQPDLEQDIVLHVLRRAHHFDPCRACVNTFIARVVDSAVAMILRDRRRLKRAAGFGSRSLDHTNFHDQKGPGSLAELLDERDSHRRRGVEAASAQEHSDNVGDVQLVLSKLPPPLQEIARRLVDASEVAIARDLGISRRQVRNAVDAIRGHFQKAGFTGI